MKDYLITLIDKEVICDNTLLFTFDIKGTGYSFEAGQYAHFTIDDPVTNDLKGHSRPLSIASSPNNKDLITVAARKGSSVFVNNLSLVPFGSRIFISKPSGNLILERDTSLPKVFIAGGIGITPVRSIIEKIMQDRANHEIYLFYSNKTESQVSFLKDFEKWSSENRNFRFIPLILDKENKNWKYEIGIIDKNMLKKYLKDLNSKIFYLTGPPGMVDSIKDLLRDEGVIPEMIKTEKFR